MLKRLTASTRPNVNNVKPSPRPDASRRRVFVISALLALWMLVIGARLVHLQTSAHDWLTGRAEAQQQDVIEMSPLRGLILDREGRELARSVTTHSIFAAPEEIENIEETVKRLSAALKIDPSVLATRLREAKEENRRFLWIARKVEHEQYTAIERLKLPGLHALKESKRFYPNKEMAAHVLGFVGLDESGLGGVEQYHNASLTGEKGKAFVERDGQRRTYRSYEVAARPGQTLVLTLDQTIQYWTEQALRAALERTRARAATAVVIDPRTGEILALANAPTFDPNEARRATPQTRVNEALQYIYEPGSTFKIVAYAAAIEEGLAKPSDRIDCQMGSIRIAGRTVRDHHAYGTLTLTEALAKSSNVAAIKLGIRVGDPRMYDYIKRFGFGGRTGVELPGETAGLLRPVDRWQPSSIGSIAIGQEIGVTPVQIAAAFATLANDGLRVAPHIVRAIQRSDAAPIRPEPEQRRVISAETARMMRGMLESVTLNGTAKKARLDGYTAAGKTGTAQKIDPRTRSYSRTKHVASFVGFAPVENPAVVIAVVLDEPIGAYHGGDAAAPVFREIAERILPALNVEPDTELSSAPEGILALQQERSDSIESGAAKRAEEIHEQSINEWEATPLSEGSNGDGEREIIYAAAAGQALLMPDLRGRSVRDAARVCAQLGLHLEARGGGRAVRQYPQWGASVEAGQRVTIDFERSN